MRLIDADALIEDLKGSLFYSDAIPLVEDAPTVEAKPEWIPCSERLPKDFEKVLTCDEKGNIHMMAHLQVFEYPFGIHPNNPQYYIPVAWMELPEPYKEDMRKKVE